MMDHRETAEDGVYRMILYNLLCFASVPVYIFGGAARKVAGINYPNSITERCHCISFDTVFILFHFASLEGCIMLVNLPLGIFSQIN